MSKHTPGPWKYFKRPSETRINALNGQDIAITVRDSWQTAEEEESNARLIAAAPDLLACCIRAVNESARVHPDFLEQLRTAIAKAVQ